ncbi:MAG TPA: tyrosine/phenylalanine carboxypeptidase domain-containing protein [Patescibacteria group bacterium]|nr:tyrosine/phenylalanine carboxypeptidase domain-containing protein [Patescibacteria group bacterium]
MTLIQKINPINKEAEKKKFFFDPNYNPQFIYPEPITKEELLHYGPIEDTYLAKAEHILNTVLKKYGTETKYLEETGGKTLTRPEVEKQIQDYLVKNGLEKLVQVHFSSNIISRTLVDKHDLYLRLPINYRENAFVGVLDHEIGTHIIRRINDERQPWLHNREKYNLGDYVETEEGMASLHANLHLEKPYMWFSALYYYATYKSKQLTFSELFFDLKKYSDDRERRWKICLRAKRGISDTSVPNALAKDQVYLRGMIHMLEWLEKNNYDPRPLYVGKLAVEDIDKIKDQSRHDILLPQFLQEDALKEYKSLVIGIKKQNSL